MSKIILSANSQYVIKPNHNSQTMKTFSDYMTASAAPSFLNNTFRLSCTQCLEIKYMSKKLSVF